MREDRIISALVGLVGACESNLKTADTDSVVIKALAFPLEYPEHDDRTTQEVIDEIYREKYTISPSCAECTAPCGNTSDYDMRRIYKAEKTVQDVKLQLLDRLQELAAYVWDCQKSGRDADVDFNLIYKAISYVSYDLDAAEFFRLLDELEDLTQNLKSGGTGNAEEDNQN